MERGSGRARGGARASAWALGCRGRGVVLAGDTAVTCRFSFPNIIILNAGGPRAGPRPHAPTRSAFGAVSCGDPIGCVAACRRPGGRPVRRAYRQRAATPLNYRLTSSAESHTMAPAAVNNRASATHLTERDSECAGRGLCVRSPECQRAAAASEEGVETSERHLCAPRRARAHHICSHAVKTSSATPTS